VLTNYWYIACSSTNLRRKPRAVKILSHNLVLFRADDGSPAALDDRCAHRGMPLAGGRVHNGAVECPYHGWCYDHAGTAVRIPSVPGDSSCLPDARVPAYRCVEQDDYIWVCLGPDPVQEKPPAFAHLGEPGWTTFRMYNRFEAPLESCLENFLDCPHATVVHKHWFRTPTQREVRCSVQALDDGAVAEYFDEPREKSLVWSLLTPSAGDMQHTDRFIAPSTSRVDYRFSEDKHYIVTSFCTAVDDKVTDVYTVITFRYKFWGPLVRLYFEPMSHRIIAQDVEVLRQQHVNLAKHEDRGFRIIEQDVLLPHIRRWRRALASGSQPSGRAEAYDVKIVI
jgi:phenylpropionate dioxygenase-like ring-hydroxylating dioxygenase large terminal subunit